MSSSWRTPSAADQQKYNLAPVDESFQPTEEEEALLKMYDTIKSFERQATRFKEQKAREKLEAKEVEFKQTLARKRRVRKNKQKAAGDSAADGDESPVDDHSDDDIDSDEENDTLRRAAKLEKMKSENESRRQALALDDTKEENMRDELLGTNESVDIGPTLKRKRLNDQENDGSALLTSMMKTQTPPHDFSKKLGFTAVKGKVLFPATPDQARWTPPDSAMNPNDGAFLVELDNFDIREASNGRGNNTIAIKFSAPGDAKRFRCVCVPLFVQSIVP